MYKIYKNKNDIYFLYRGNFVNESISFTQLASSEDNQRKKITVLINDNMPIDSSEETHLKKAKYIICPTRNENIRININDFQIKLFDCKNKHEKESLTFDEFEKSQMIDESKIKCDFCQNSNKSKTYENTFYICFSCKKNLCPLCKASHEKNHVVIDYSQKDFKCNIHNEFNSLYCNEFNKDICIMCEKEHINHKKTSHGELMPDKNKLEEDKNNLRKKIEEFEKDIQEIIKIFNEVIRNIENYYNIYDEIVTGYEIQNRNYIILQNINYMQKYNSEFIESLNKITENKNINSKFENILKMWNKIEFKKNEIIKEENIVEIKKDENHLKSQEEKIEINDKKEENISSINKN